MLRPGTAVLLRPDRSVQFGTHPAHAVVLPVPRTVDPGQVLQVMLQARAGMTADELAATLGYCGFEGIEARSIAEELQRSGVVAPAVEHSVPVLRYGKPALALADALFGHGVTVNWMEAPRTAEAARASYIATGQGRTAQRDVILLPGGIFPPPDVQFWLHEKLIPHYPTGVLDGRLVLGPLIVPGRSACLNCIDQGYVARDALWRSTRAQATARPASYTAAEHGVLAELTARIVERHILPWRDAGMDVRAIPPVLAHRQVFDPDGFAIRPEATLQQGDCVLCRMSRVGLGLDAGC